jgi:murein DD-endopeptidase MepM/ murein hydrolase activator NlpD
MKLTHFRAQPVINVAFQLRALAIGSALLAVMMAASVAYSEPPSAYAAATKGATESSTLAPELPRKWLPSKGRQCIYKGRYRGFCQGPRRAPMPWGPAAELAGRLGLGDEKAVSHLLLGAPKPQWLAAAGDGAFPEQLLWPVVGGKMWRGFGRVKRGNKRARRHKGVDIGASAGTLIRAAKSGIVAYADNGVRGYGNFLVMVHPDQSTAFYAHCRAIYVFPGQRIERGRIVGEVGHTGIARGSHLHFEYRERGYLRDPEKRFVGVPED